MPKRVVVEFAGDTSKLDAAFAKVKSGSSGLEKAVKGIAAGAAFGLVSAQISDAIGAASDLNESLSKSNQVFGSSATAIDSWAKQGATSFGLSRQAALEAASSFGNMFSQLGVASTQAASMSQNIVELAADFASFHNADISQVIDAQSAAFRGEYDSLQRFLPLINAAAVEQEAMAMTGKKNKDSLTAQEKALAVNSLMFKGAGDALGDFARTADGAANQQRTLAAEMDNLKSSIGEGLLPIFVDIARIISEDVLPAIGQLTGATNEPPDKANHWGKFVNTLKEWSGDVAGWAAEIPGPLLKLGGIFSKSFKEASDATDDFAEKMHRSRQEAFLGTHANDAHSAALKVAEGVTKDATKATEGKAAASAKSTKELDAETKATVKLKDAQLDARAAEQSLEQSKHNLGKAQDAYNKFLETGGIDIEKVKRAQEDLVSAQKDVEAATKDVAEAQKAVNDALKPATMRERLDNSNDQARAQNDLTLAQLDAQDAQKDYTDLLNSGKASQEELTRAWIKADTAARDVTTAEQRLSDTQTAANDLAQKGTTNTSAYKDAVEILKEKQDALTVATTAQTTAQQALVTAQSLGKDYADQLWEKTQDLAAAHLDLDQKTWGAQKAQDALKVATDATKESVRDAWGHVKGYNAELAKIPPEKKTTVTYEEIYAIPAGTSNTNAQNYANYLKSVPANADPVPYDMWAKRNARASGGPVTGGRPYLVGEMGPELFVPGRSGTIIPNGSGGGGNVNIVVNGWVGDDVALTRKIIDAIQREARLSGLRGFN